LMSDVNNQPRRTGEYISTCSIPAFLLNKLNYTIGVEFEVPGARSILSGNTVNFEVSELTINQLGTTNAPAPSGTVHPLLDWEVKAA
jgi:hypothetical protein